MKNPRTLFSAIVLAAILPLVASCKTSTSSPGYVKVWDSGYMEKKGGSGNKKSLGMQVWYAERHNADGSYDWQLTHTLIAENKGLTGWSAANELYSFSFDFSYTDGAGTHTPNGSMNLQGQSQVNAASGVLASGKFLTTNKRPTFQSKHARASRYGGESGITIEWNG